MCWGIGLAGLENEDHIRNREDRVKRHALVVFLRPEVQIPPGSRVDMQGWRKSSF